MKKIILMLFLFWFLPVFSQSSDTIVTNIGANTFQLKFNKFINPHFKKMDVSCNGCVSFKKPDDPMGVYEITLPSLNGTGRRGADVILTINGVSKKDTTGLLKTIKHLSIYYHEYPSFAVNNKVKGKIYKNELDNLTFSLVNYHGNDSINNDFIRYKKYPFIDIKVSDKKLAHFELESFEIYYVLFGVPRRVSMTSINGGDNPFEYIKKNYDDIYNIAFQKIRVRNKNTNSTSQLQAGAIFNLSD